MFVSHAVTKVVRSLILVVCFCFPHAHLVLNCCLRRSTMVRTRQTARKSTGGTAPRKFIKRDRKTALAPPDSTNDVVMTAANQKDGQKDGNGRLIVADSSQVSRTNGIWRARSVDVVIGVLLRLLERRGSLCV